MKKGRIIREARVADIDCIMPVLEAAKRIMRSDGNMSQWSDGYPSKEAILADISRSGRRRLFKALIHDSDNTLLLYLYPHSAVRTAGVFIGIIKMPFNFVTFN